jgi:hypothetical protein
MKSLWIGLLVCLNAILLTGLILASYSPPAAYAQDATGLAGRYMVVAGEIQDQYDALYLLDTRSRNLYGFVFDRGRRQLRLSAARDLERDFRHNRGG